MPTHILKLSILDPSDVRRGSTAGETITETIELARLAEHEGYSRFWVAEHHNALCAGSTPEILMVKLASETTSIRIGSGGIMLPHHSTLRVAENFRMLETLFPQRIDLGMGRNPGTNNAASILLNPYSDFSEESYIEQLTHLQAFFLDQAVTEEGPVIAVPMSATLPQQWILSAGGSSSSIAAQFGMGLAIAKFINGKVLPETATKYIREYQSGDIEQQPQVLLALYVICSDSEEDAALLRKYWNYTMLAISQKYSPIIDDIAAINDYVFSKDELKIIDDFAGQIVSGLPWQVRQELIALAESFGAPELMLLCVAPTKEARFRTFELIAQEFNLR
jgi:luciferase family oxidoreductase group 1